MQDPIVRALLEKLGCDFGGNEQFLDDEALEEALGKQEDDSQDMSESECKEALTREINTTSAMLKALEDTQTDDQGGSTGSLLPDTDPEAATLALMESQCLPDYHSPDFEELKKNLVGQEQLGVKSHCVLRGRGCLSQRWKGVGWANPAKGGTRQ